MAVSREDREYLNGLTTSDPPGAPAAAAPRVRPQQMQPMTVNPPAPASRPVVPNDTPLGRRIQSVTLAGSLPINQDQANLKRYGEANDYLTGMASGPPLGGQRVPYGERTITPVFPTGIADLEQPQDPGVPGARVAAPAQTQPPQTAVAAPIASPIAQAPVRPQVQTLPTATVQPGQTTLGGTTSVNGRPLGYGETVNGVRTFSDGSGQGRGGVPRTMSEMQIANLAKGDRLSTYSSADGFAMGPNGSFVGSPGNANSPGSPTAPAQNTVPSASAAVARPVRPTSADVAASDLASIANEDPRSPAGIAARNLRLNQEYAGSRSERDAAGAARAAQIAAITSGQEQSTRLQEAQTREAGANQRAGLAADTDIRTAQINRPQPSVREIVNADGTLSQVDNFNTSRQVRTPAGEPVRPAQTKSDATVRRRDQVIDALNKSAGDLLAGATAGAAPNDTQIAAARLQAARLNGLRVAQNKEGQQMVEVDGEWVNL